MITWSQDDDLQGEWENDEGELKALEAEVGTQWIDILNAYFGKTVQLVWFLGKQGEIILESSFC